MDCLFKIKFKNDLYDQKVEYEFIVLFLKLKKEKKKSINIYIGVKKKLTNQKDLIIKEKKSSLRI